MCRRQSAILVGKTGICIQGSRKKAGNFVKASVCCRAGQNGSRDKCEELFREVESDQRSTKLVHNFNSTVNDP
jgi:hypothetical protein